MEIINEAEYRKRLKTGVQGAYVFFGAEDYLKAYAINATRAAVCPDEAFACFNDITIDFPEFTPDALMRALEAPPMMADKKLVVLKSFNFNALKPSETEAVISLLEEFGGDDMNVLIISVIPEGITTGYLPKNPSPLLKRIGEHATAVNFEPSSASKLTVWVARHFEHNGVRVRESTAKYLVEYCGSDMMKLSSEIEKLCSYAHAHQRDEVTPEDIRHVAVPETEFDPFAFSNATMEGNRAAALEALAVMKFRQVKPEFALSEISTLYSKMYMAKQLKKHGANQNDIAKLLDIHSYKAGLYIKATDKMSDAQLKRALELCLDADLAMKTYAKHDYEQIEKLICLL